MKLALCWSNNYAASGNGTDNGDQADVRLEPIINAMNTNSPKTTLYSPSFPVSSPAATP